MVYPHLGSSLLARKQNVTQLDHGFPVTGEVTIVLPDSFKLQNVTTILAGLFPTLDE